MLTRSPQRHHSPAGRTRTSSHRLALPSLFIQPQAPAPGFCGFVNTPTRLPPPHPPLTQQVYKIGFDFLLFLQRQWWGFLCNSRTVSLRGRELISGLTDPKFKPVSPS